MNLPLAGQRWISTSEPELGLGLVLDADRSGVRLLFPASGEMRNYALESAPLKRIVFRPGDRIAGQDNQEFVIETVRESDGLMIYEGAGISLREPELADRSSESDVVDLLLSGSADDNAQFERRVAVARKHHWLVSQPTRGLSGGRIEWIPHQIAIAHEASRRLRPRILLADEVGLGKTIEACLILHHALITGRVSRALILVPDALIHQWFVELLRRFHLHFAIYDRERCDSLADQNPFLDEQCVLCPVSLLADSGKRTEQAIAAGWDLLIVDEAHHLEWSAEQASPAYTAVDALAQVSASVILLTATPEQMGLESHFAHLRLLDRDRYHSLDEFLVEQSGYHDVAETVEGLLADKREQEAREILEAHGPGRVMFRNTREVIKGFPERIPHPHPVADKVDWLTRFVESEPTRKVLVMTRSPESVIELQEALKTRTGAQTVQFHEGQSLLERDRQAAWFAEADGAQVMIASDIGGEGRNFQFVQHLVLYDLPAEPERIEQRIGRLDRIGQQDTIHLHLPFIEHSAEAGRFRWHHEGLDVFTRPLQCGHRCYERFRDRLDVVDDALIRETREAVGRMEMEQRSGRNRLIQWKHELDEDVEKELRLLKAVDADPGLLPFARALWGVFGLEVETLADQDYHLKAGQFYTGDLPVREEGTRFTPSRVRALEREDMDLLTWDHPLVLGGIEALLSSQSGRVAIVKTENGEGPAVEAVLVLEAPAPARLELGRFLPPEVLQLCVNALGQPIEADFGELTDLPSPALLEHEAFRSEWLPQRIRDLQDLAEKRCAEIKAHAMERAERLLGDELKRLVDLKKRNNHVRDEEIHALVEQLEGVRNAIQDAQPRLDAIRLLL